MRDQLFRGRRRGTSLRGHVRSGGHESQPDDRVSTGVFHHGPILRRRGDVRVKNSARPPPCSESRSAAFVLLTERRVAVDSDWGAGMELMGIRQALTRIRLEYTLMPQMRLSQPQVQRLLDLPSDACEVALAALLHSRFLTRDAAGLYCRHQAHEHGNDALRVLRDDAPRPSPAVPGPSR